MIRGGRDLVFRWHFERDDKLEPLGPTFASALKAKEWRWASRWQGTPMKLFKRVAGGWEEVV